MYVLNTTWAIKIAWKVIEKFMADHMRKKMTLSDKNTMDDLIEAFHPSQLETKFGGAATNATVFWPPIMPSTEYGIDEKSLVSEDEYLNIIENNKLLKPRPDLIHHEEIKQELYQQEGKEVLQVEDNNSKDKVISEENKIQENENAQDSLQKLAIDGNSPATSTI